MDFSKRANLDMQAEAVGLELCYSKAYACWTATHGGFIVGFGISRQAALKHALSDRSVAHA